MRGVEELAAGFRVLAVVESTPDGPHSASDDGPTLEHLHVEAGADELVRRDQAGEAGPDHDDARAGREGASGTDGQGCAHSRAQELTAIHGGID